MTGSLDQSIVQHLARVADEATRQEAKRLRVAPVATFDDPRSMTDSVIRTLTQDEVAAYVVAALDVARTQLAPLDAPGAVRVELVEDVHERMWSDPDHRPRIREHMRARWARDLERANLRPSTWPPITVTPDPDRDVVRLTIAGHAVPTPAGEQHP